MLFNSYCYIFLFLPAVLFLYFLLSRYRLTVGSKLWLFFASLVFYGWWNPRYLPLITGSIVFNYMVGRLISRQREKGRFPYSRSLLVIGVLGNLALLGYFKYADFFLSNINSIGHLTLPLLRIVLPLGISFFTFTQIAYLVDTEKGKVKEYSALNYGLFVTFFPHLLAGPIIHHSEMMPQFDRLRNKVVNYSNLTPGICLFFIGLFKKLVIADTFAVWANNGFDTLNQLTVIQAWVTSLSYTLQLYYDFSGYTDMALGSSLMFNIKLPINFNSPYRSLDIQEFWRRWHITLGRFMRDYVYIPLGGNRVPEGQILLNIMITFFIVGLWHGAGWTFVLWGCMHGAALVIHRLWKRSGFSMPSWIAWFLTFNFINIGWVFFRAKTFGDALKVLKGMAGIDAAALPKGIGIQLRHIGGFVPALDDLFGKIGNNGKVIVCMFIIFLPLSFLFKNSNEMAERFRPNIIQLVLFVLVAWLSVLFLGTYSEFLYFRF
ncbi:MAG: MBOAT family protein [Syntrophorhabdales bacterium]|jgi:D-alanyl-lipoteichoic acid acyltransferase DltB (MBOAT superfamily)